MDSPIYNYTIDLIIYKNFLCKTFIDADKHFDKRLINDFAFSNKRFAIR